MILSGIAAMSIAIACEEIDTAGSGEYVESEEYAFCITYGTMPTLYAGLHLVENEIPTYVYFDRIGTFNTEAYPKYANICPYMGGDSEDQANMRIWMKETIKSINGKNPDAIFHLYADDLRSGPMSYDLFASQGIDMSRVKVHMLSDGTGTYNEFYNNFKSTNNTNQKTGEEYWKQLVSEINDLDWNNGEGNYVETRLNPEFEGHWHWLYPLATQENYELVLHDGSLLETDDPYIKERLKEMHFVNKNVVEMFQELTPEKQEVFLKMVPYDKKVYDDLMDASPKPNLIINGTSNQPENQRIYVEEIYNRYKNDYDIFFEPHPADNSYLDYEQAFPGLKNIPKMAFEFVLMFIEPKINAIGGFPSTIYLTVPVEKVRFMFATGPESMPRPLNIVFGNAPDGQIEYLLDRMQ